ncbi:TspO/MBR family protein [Nocardioides sp. CFH 31398]|uniref:TspO/MBR family protein n=1 Tax=Nocardioides sp. CFH 31398 TaxID=2919579 RepID=UPI001F056A4C|nr:TspO/MBR family protein [Nocardioides sp. CFH 31398]MCH1865342.1 tryptophan-rich sensory protein [Nocardioides sp. CFH 31398]
MSSSATGLDRARQVTVTVAEVACVLGTLVGVGVLGTEVSAVSGGALSADSTLVAPAGPAFSIWSVIYAGLAAYTVHQWLPGQATSERQRSIGWLAAASMVLNAAWLLVVQQGWIWGSVVVIVALLATLVAIGRRLTAQRHDSVVDLVVVDGTFGLYLGWVAVATGANLTAALVGTGMAATGPVGYVVSLLILAGVTVGGVALARGLGGRVTVAAATVWGLGWLAWGRLTDSPESVLVAVAAVLAALVLAAAVVRVRLDGARSSRTRRGRSAVVA